VAQLMVRNVDEAVVRELKKRAARRNHSAEQEHREILEQALLRPRRRSLAEVLAAMPDAGKDTDFERRQTWATNSTMAIDAETLHSPFPFLQKQRRRTYDDGSPDSRSFR